MVHSISFQTKTQKEEATFEFLNRLKESPVFYKIFREQYAGWDLDKRKEYVSRLFIERGFFTDEEMFSYAGTCPTCSFMCFGIDLMLCSCKKMVTPMVDFISFMPGSPHRPVKETIYEDGLPDIAITFEYFNGSTLTTYVPQMLVMDERVSLPLLCDEKHTERVLDNSLEELSVEASDVVCDLIYTTSNTSLMLSCEQRVQDFDTSNYVKPCKLECDIREVLDKTGTSDCKLCLDGLYLQSRCSFSYSPPYLIEKCYYYEDSLAKLFYHKRVITPFSYGRYDDMQLIASQFMDKGNHKKKKKNMNLNASGSTYLPNLGDDFTAKLNQIRKILVNGTYSVVDYDEPVFGVSYFIYAVKCFMESLGYDYCVNRASSFNIYDYVSYEKIREFIYGGITDELLSSFVQIASMCKSWEEIYYFIKLRACGLTNAHFHELLSFSIRSNVKIAPLLQLVKYRTAGGMGFLSRDYAWNALFMGDSVPKVKYRDLMGWDLFAECSIYSSGARYPSLDHRSLRMCKVPNICDVYLDLAKHYDPKLLVTYYTHRAFFVKDNVEGDGYFGLVVNMWRHPK